MVEERDGCRVADGWVADGMMSRWEEENEFENLVLRKRIRPRYSTSRVLYIRNFYRYFSISTRTVS